MSVDEIKKIGVVGAGLMGHGIAQEFALAGYEVMLYDISEEKLQQAMTGIQANLSMLVQIGLIRQSDAAQVLPRIKTGNEIDKLMPKVDYVVEAVVEDLALKQDVFMQLDQLCADPVIFASNTSTLLPSKLAEATVRPEQVLVTHYFNPPFLLPLVEVVRGQETTDETVDTVMQLLKKVGKQPALVQKEVPGFIGNRLQAALMREALSLVKKGVATPQDIDIVVKNGFGRRYSAAGVFEVFEMAGWDLVQSVMVNLMDDIETSNDVTELINEKVAANELGFKTGKGFYDWTPASGKALQNKVAQALIAIARNS